MQIMNITATFWGESKKLKGYILIVLVENKEISLKPPNSTYSTVMILHIHTMRILGKHKKHNLNLERFNKRHLPTIIKSYYNKTNHTSGPITHSDETISVLKNKLRSFFEEKQNPAYAPATSIFLAQLFLCRIFLQQVNLI